MRRSTLLRLLLIEDQPKLLDAMRRGFQSEGHDVYCALTARDGFQFTQTVVPDLIVLDLQLPDEDGLHLLARIRETGCDAPVLIATARDAVENRIEGLDIGADDYIVKPIEFGELSARVRALLRRYQRPAGSVLVYDDLVLELFERHATRGGVDMELTARQFDMLAYLMRHKNQLVTRDMLARDIWKAETATWTNVIEVQINRLRRKIEGRRPSPILHTVRGEGYWFGERPC